MLTMILYAFSFSVMVYAENTGQEFSFSVLLSYNSYYEKYSSFPEPCSKITVGGNDYTDISETGFSSGSIDGKNNVLIWQSSGGSVSYEINIAESGIYSILISYFALGNSTTDNKISVCIDGEIPYSSAMEIPLYGTWENNSEPSYDIYGNQNHPSLSVKNMWKTSWLCDNNGIFSEPLIFYLEKGSHKITLSSENACLAIEYLTFSSPEKYIDYDEYALEYAESESSGNSELLRIEGENFRYASDSSLCPTYDRNNAMCSPSDPVKTVFNTVGNESWNKPFQSLTWEFSTEKNDWYRIGIKYRQNEMRGVCTYRRIYIDGKVPFSEFSSVTFPYSSNWNLLSPHDNEDNEFLLYLTAGQHTITLEAVTAGTGNTIRSVDDLIDELNECYRKIIMITGTNPDKYTDYYIHEKIPELTSTFSHISEELKNIKENTEQLSGVNGSEASQLERMYVILDKCVKNPLKIPEYVPHIKDNISALSSWSRTFCQQPLEIDYIELATENTDFSEYKCGFFKSLVFMIKSFIGSFFNSYSILSDYDDENALEIWVCLGRDQTQIIKELTDRQFTEEYGIKANVNLVQGTILETCMSGNSPDIALFIGDDFPVSLASRDLTVCLSDFNDYNEVSERFHKNADIQYTYDGKVYALPISQSWAMMFYRKDILSELGFSSTPETWQELTNMLPVLQRNHMSAGLVLPSLNISSSTESGHTYAAMLIQNGLSYYNDDLSVSGLSNKDALRLFEFWTDLYSEYGLEQTYDAFSRFRTGEYPIVIQDYSFANKLDTAAPEITGLWDFTSIPGSYTDDGTVSHAVNSTGSAGVIFNDSNNIENAWLFLKWFTSDEVQTEYSKRTESISGRLGRFTPANTTALENIAWTTSELERIMKQREELCEIPVIPASYAVTRNIMNAFRETVNNKSNPYYTLMIYDKDINNEIKRKNQNMTGK